MREFANLYVAEGDGKAVILEVDDGVVHVGEVGVDLELAVGDEVAELGGVAVVLEDFDPVEPVLDVAFIDEDAGGVPLADGVDGFGVVGGAGGGDKVVEGGDGAIAVFATLGVRVYVVVEDLVLVADGGAGTFLEVEVDEVEDAAIGAGRGAEVYRELVVGEFARGDDVAGVATFFAAKVGGREQAVLDNPAGGGEGAVTLAAPAVRGFAVPEELPTLGLFLLCEGVGGLRKSGDSGGEEERREDVGARKHRGPRYSAWSELGSGFADGAVTLRLSTYSIVPAKDSVPVTSLDCWRSPLQSSKLNRDGTLDSYLLPENSLLLADERWVDQELRLS